jgi:hypothetical protein
MAPKRSGICPIKNTICAVLVTGNFVMHSCNLGTHCEYLPHENPSPPYAYGHPRDTFTVVSSGPISPSYVSPDFQDIGSDPDRPGNRLYSLTISLSSSSTSSGSAV